MDQMEQTVASGEAATCPFDERDTEGGAIRAERRRRTWVEVKEGAKRDGKRSGK